MQLLVEKTHKKVVIVGIPGVGKTSLVTAIVEKLSDTGIGILLSVDILINYYNQLVKEQVEVVMPRLGALLGRT